MKMIRNTLFNAARKFPNTPTNFAREWGLCLCLLLLTCGAAQARTEWPHMVPSKDGSQISYEMYGQGEPTLVFIHGWSCDSRYWRMQIPYFSQKHRVIVLDLAGHGHSSSSRTQYTMQAFGEDVKAVAESTGSQNIILIGHSMGGAVIAEAARLMPGRVKGLIGIDTLENIEYPLTRKELDDMLAPLKKDFPAGSRAFVQEMFAPSTDPMLRDWILADMAAAPPSVALSAMNEMMSQYITGDAARIFAAIRIPVMTINGDLWPIDYAANRRHMLSFDATIMKGADHFLMLDRPAEFNQALEKTITALTAKKAQ